MGSKTGSLPLSKKSAISKEASHFQKILPLWPLKNYPQNPWNPLMRLTVRNFMMIMMRSQEMSHSCACALTSLGYETSFGVVSLTVMFAPNTRRRWVLLWLDKVWMSNPSLVQRYFNVCPIYQMSIQVCACSSAGPKLVKEVSFTPMRIQSKSIV